MELIKPPTKEDIEKSILESEKRKGAFKDACVNIINDYMKDTYFDATHKSRTSEIREEVWIRYNLYPKHVHEVYTEICSDLRELGWELTASFSPNRMYFTLSPDWII